MTLLAITVFGHDRPGIIADVTAVLADLGTNLEDTTMTLLRGHFAMTLVAASPRSTAEVQAALAPLAVDGLLEVSVREVPPESDPEHAGTPYVLSVHGGDRPGIVSAVTRTLAAVGGNVTDLTTRLTADLYVIVAEVDVPAAADVGALRADLEGVGRRLGVEVRLRPQDTDVL